ncbi:MBL fold metallo-hydrolase [Haliangium ochraceum]|uniref:Beta-lactamase domain protein n=1 Tax=Haliangium ochraceum (strain DSM 14365 / JCM 11303 / SMP-2) TaxID=502025 RepID=D0LLH1_HALO1|nr:MBL fold metallo-hydrolase [Haliangium ochraceum]ACY13188.1 beta-lactamase domain protein [Haliangium ochraceum DSM 14365]
MTFAVTFWGTRGSIACPTPRHLIYGGNTSCVQLQLGTRQVVLDAGTGIRELGAWFLQNGIRKAVMLLTHAHWDHINGFPFFAPAFRKESELLIMAGSLRASGGVYAALEGQMTKPMFPVPLDAMHSDCTFEDFDAGQRFSLGDGIEVQTVLLNHPSGATGYRIEYGGKSLCYVTDTEHVRGQRDKNILRLIDGADLVIYDSTYTDETFEPKIGWGHSTWQEGVRLCREAKAKRLVIFHHDPEHTDDIMAAIEKRASEEWSETIVAREGMRIDLLDPEQ